MTAKKHRPDRSRKGTAASAGRPGTYRRGAPRPYPDHHPNQPNPLNLGSGAGTGNRSGSSSGSLCADGSPFGGPMLRRSVSSSGGSDAPKAAAGNPGGGETLGDGLGRVVEELGGAVVAAEVARCGKGAEVDGRQPTRDRDNQDESSHPATAMIQPTGRSAATDSRPPREQFWAFTAGPKALLGSSSKPSRTGNASRRSTSRVGWKKSPTAASWGLFEACPMMAD
jgi:hypothetical protein